MYGKNESEKKCSRGRKKSRTWKSSLFLSVPDRPEKLFPIFLVFFFRRIIFHRSDASTRVERVIIKISKQKNCIH